MQRFDTDDDDGNGDGDGDGNNKKIKCHFNQCITIHTTNSKVSHVLLTPYTFSMIVFRNDFQTNFEWISVCNLWVKYSISFH